MLITLKELLDKLAVGYEMSAYETCPWSVYDEEKGITCSAEVRMGSDADEIEAELQLVHDNPEGDTPPVEQILWLYGKPQANVKWGIKAMRIKGEDYVNKMHGWEEKGCRFFSACAQEMKMGKFPDIEELLKREIHEDSSGRTSMQGGSSKAPKIKPQKLLGMKGGRGF